MGVTRSQLAFAQSIRGPIAKTLGASLSKLFAGREAIDLSSGDLPLCLEGSRYPTVEAAAREVPPEAMAYNHKFYGNAQHIAWDYLTGLESSRMEKESARVHIIPGISRFMGDALGISATALGYPVEEWHNRTPLVVVIPPVHPHWIASMISSFGYGSIRTIKRGSDGLPDIEDVEKVFREIDRPFIVVLTPDENPGEVCTPNKLLINGTRTGIIDRIRNHTSAGILLFDAMYMDLAWGPNAGKRQELIAGIEEIGVRALVMHSLSKIFMRPGNRVGAVAYVGPILNDPLNIGIEVIRGLRQMADGAIKNGVSVRALAALCEAYSGREVVTTERLRILSTVMSRVVTNETLINSSPIGKAYPHAVTESGFYGLHKVDLNNTPWHDVFYRQWLIDSVETRLDLENIGVADVWGAFRSLVKVSPAAFGPSDAFAVELAMKGVQVLPAGQFYPKFVDDVLTASPWPIRNPDGSDSIAFRTVTAYPEEQIREAVVIIRRVIEERTDAFERGNWRDAYK